VEAQNAGVGPVALIDADPQGSLSHWWNARKASNHCSSRSVRSNWERR
jgi:chromosome partitioning protein